MSKETVWFLLGAGAIYLLAHGRLPLPNVSFAASFGDTGASTPPDQRWAHPTDMTDTYQGTWDPMGTPTWYKLYPQNSTGNKVMTGGGYNA
jgi:hypothetical protein